MGKIHASWTYTWISLLKTDQQIPASMDIHVLSKLTSMQANIDTAIHDSSMDIHVYSTDIHKDSSTWVYNV